VRCDTRTSIASDRRVKLPSPVRSHSKLCPRNAWQSPAHLGLGSRRRWPPAISPASSGSSPRFSPALPPRGTRAMSRAGARMTFFPAVRTSWPSAAP
jgi:hypothetical protein